MVSALGWAYFTPCRPPRSEGGLWRAIWRFAWKHGVHFVLHAMLTRHKPDRNVTIVGPAPESASNRRPYRMKSQPRGMHTTLAGMVDGNVWRPVAASYCRRRQAEVSGANG